MKGLLGQQEHEDEDEEHHAGVDGGRCTHASHGAPGQLSPGAWMKGRWKVDVKRPNGGPYTWVCLGMRDATAL